MWIGHLSAKPLPDMCLWRADNKHVKSAFNKLPESEFKETRENRRGKRKISRNEDNGMKEKKTRINKWIWGGGARGGFFILNGEERKKKINMRQNGKKKEKRQK